MQVAIKEKGGKQYERETHHGNQTSLNIGDQNGLARVAVVLHVRAAAELLFCVNAGARNGDAAAPLSTVEAAQSRCNGIALHETEKLLITRTPSDDDHRHREAGRGTQCEEGAQRRHENAVTNRK